MDSLVPALPDAGWRFCIAPMMERTDRHFRFLARLLTRRARLYTEMLHARAVLGPAGPRLLAFDPAEHPVAVQLGGSEPALLAEAAARAVAAGYDEVNLNVGCPSPRVSAGRFGACLMKEPALVAECIAAMREATARARGRGAGGRGEHRRLPATGAVDAGPDGESRTPAPGGSDGAVPVTVKTRIGVDEIDGYDHLARFVATVAAAGCRVFVVHARKAWLQGLSPEQNRTVPPLRYEVVRRLKGDFPELTVVLNGGVCTLDAAAAHLASGLDGVMVGRAAWDEPWLLARVDAALWGEPGSAADRHGVVHTYVTRHVVPELEAGTPLPRLVKPLLRLFQGMPGAARWRRALSEEARRRPSDAAVVLEALACVEAGGADAASPAPASACRQKAAT